MADPLGPDGAPEPTLEDVAATFLSERQRVGGRAEAMVRELSHIDKAIYRAIAATPSPTLDEPVRRLSNAANRSALWIGIAAALAVFGGRTGRRAAIKGLVSVGVTSAVVNVGLKTIRDRARPDREAAGVLEARQVDMPASSSFPSGHSASGFAFAGAVGHEIPWLGAPLRGIAAAVAYSRVHTGVHYPGDAVVGSLVGAATGEIVAGALSARRPAGRAPSGRARATSTS